MTWENVAKRRAVEAQIRSAVAEVDRRDERNDLLLTVFTCVVVAIAACWFYRLGLVGPYRWFAIPASRLFLWLSVAFSMREGEF